MQVGGQDPVETRGPRPGSRHLVGPAVRAGLVSSTAPSAAPADPAASAPSAAPAVVAARRLARELLAPNAERTDRDGVSPAYLRAISDAGLLGLNGPVASGGGAVGTPVFREVVEILAGADCSTWFVQAQHHLPVAMVASSTHPVRDRMLAPLSRGELLAGVAFAHLRRSPAVPVRATPVGSGFRFDGRAPWFTGWGLNDVMLLAGVDAESATVWALIDVGRRGLSAQPLALAALGATSTVALELDGVTATAGEVVARIPMAAWSVADGERARNVNPAVFGVTRAAITLLAGGAPPAASCAAALACELEAVRAEAYRLWDGRPVADSVSERLAAKAEAGALMLRATSALVASGSGSSMSRDAPAQRLAREALFLLVQAQTSEGRAATLNQLAARAAEPGTGSVSGVERSSQ